MQFKNPELLYALFLLLIPILVHLFQLRRFKKTRFSNVAFLQAVTQNTRKSSQIKKWLILCTRLLAIATLVLAFAQPYLPQTNTATQERETVIFLDNSFSMQSKGQKGPLLIESIQEIIGAIPPDKNFTLLTNDKIYSNINTDTDRNTLLDISYSPISLTPDAISLKAKNEFSNNEATFKELVVISDFQDADWKNAQNLPKISQNWIKLEPVNYNNLSIDSVALSRKANDYELQVMVHSNQNSDASVPISLFNAEKLQAKAAVTFTDSQDASTTFSIAADENFKGKLTLGDPNLLFDNTFYFSINKTAPLKILSVNNANDLFLKKLYPEPEFTYQSVDFKNLDYSIISQQNVIILNEIDNIPSSLIIALQSFTNNGGKVIFIPNISSKSANYDQILTTYGFAPFGQINTESKLITSINYDHPVYAGVFEKRVSNFQYPSLSKTFPLASNNTLLRLENGNPFLAENNGLFVFSGSINYTNSNFKNSPLIV
ncbi:MAG: BatA domain-containing protein, partial [Leeuwenhoekiella sp.]